MIIINLTSLAGFRPTDQIVQAVKHK